MKNNRIVLAITGASGAVYGLRLCEELIKTGCEPTLLISKAGFQVLKEETGLDWQGEAAEVTAKVREQFAGSGLAPMYFADDDFMAPFASGSSAPAAMVICPCTMGTVGRVAAGLSSTLIERTADVMLKERRPLVLVPRETPLSEIHLENLLKLARAGARIVPAMPAFYHQPESVDDLVNFMVGKVLDQLGVEHSLFKRWGDSGDQGIGTGDR
ncbi:MAG: UbiX family flavin prenyltransferase [Geobacter sp.]|nr:UbiX family flavin prenyltransferase [Geobacter sp.]